MSTEFVTEILTKIVQFMAVTITPVGVFYSGWFFFKSLIYKQ